MRRHRRQAWFIVAVVMALSYRAGHPWSGLAGGAALTIEAALITMLRFRLRQYRAAREDDPRR